MATIVKTSLGTWKALIRKTGWPATAKTFRTKRDAEDWGAVPKTKWYAAYRRATSGRHSVWSRHVQKHGTRCWRCCESENNASRHAIWANGDSRAYQPPHSRQHHVEPCV